ncbi:MAG: threonylcarbamoyl-AMP synthase [Chitinophagaceae bacterium]|nr:threonylcarbamoyl-AMP synthase [Chitinophagaceae bacterium]
MQTIIGEDIEKARHYLMNGELVGIPTETVYGLAGNALDENAVVKIFEAKNRPSFNPLIIHVGSWQMLEKYVEHVPAKAKLLADKFTPGPLTFLLPKKNTVPDMVTAGSDKVAIRIPNHPLTLSLLKSLDFPLAAPSANPFGYISPTTAQHVLEGLEGKIPYILDGGAANVGLESTIIGFDERENVLLYRTGGISAEQIEEVLKEKIAAAQISPQKNPETSGRLKSHYAPHTPLYIGNIDELKKQFDGKQIAIISFTRQIDGIDENRQFVLSPSGNLAEAAKNLFTALRLTDKLKVDVILAEKFPDEGIGRAINDRLGKAQAENKK